MQKNQTVEKTTNPAVEFPIKSLEKTCVKFYRLQKKIPLFVLYAKKTTIQNRKKA